MSRKLIYAAGLLVCFQFHLPPFDAEIRAEFRDSEFKTAVIDNLNAVFRPTPLEILASNFIQFEHLRATARKVFDSYDAFIGILADAEKRKHLKDLTQQKAHADPVYQNARTLSHRFRDGLIELFFDTKSPMNELTKKYGVF